MRPGHAGRRPGRDPHLRPGLRARLRRRWPTRPSRAATRTRRRSGPGSPPAPAGRRAPGAGPASRRRLAAPRPTVAPAGADEPDVESPYPALAAAAERLGRPRLRLPLAGRAGAPRRGDAAAAAGHPAAPVPPLRPARPRGARVDLRTTLRLAQRSGGYPVRLARHRLRCTPPPAGRALRHLRLDGAVRPGPAAARLLPRPRRRPGRGVHLRHPADPADPGAGQGTARGGAGTGRPAPRPTGPAAPASARR